MSNQERFSLSLNNLPSPEDSDALREEDECGEADDAEAEAPPAFASSERFSADQE